MKKRKQRLGVHGEVQMLANVLIGLTERVAKLEAGRQLHDTVDLLKAGAPVAKTLVEHEERLARLEKAVPTITLYGNAKDGGKMYSFEWTNEPKGKRVECKQCGLLGSTCGVKEGRCCNKCTHGKKKGKK